MKEVVDLLKEQKKLELSHVKALTETMKTVENPMIKVMLDMIVHDSKKHATIAQALVDVQAGAVPHKLDMDLGPATNFNQNVKQHVRVELDMIERLEEAQKMVKDDRVLKFIEYLIDEEKRHHTLLKEFSLLLDRSSTMDEYLDLFQKYMIVPPEY
jgi:rubrerythrin